MLARSVLLLSTLVLLPLASATEAQAKRFKVFSGSARAATPAPRPEAVGAAAPSMPSPAAIARATSAPTSPAATREAVAPTGRSGSFVFIGGGRSAPASTAPAAADPAAAGGLPVAPAEESVRQQAQAKPILATATDAPTPTSRQAKRTHRAHFEVVSAPKTFSFEVVAPRK